LEKLGVHKRFVHISFRIPVELKEELEDDVKKQKTNLNSLGNAILAGHMFFDRIAEREGVVMLGRQVFAQIINVIPAEQAERIGKEIGQKMIERAFTVLNIKNDLDNLIARYIIPMGIYSGWYNFSEVNIGPNRKLMLEHNYGQNWSLFLKQYLSGTIRSVTGIEPKIEINKGLLTIIF
jgi:hypothetical protein